FRVVVYSRIRSQAEPESLAEVGGGRSGHDGWNFSVGRIDDHRGPAAGFQHGAEHGIICAADVLSGIGRAGVSARIESLLRIGRSYFVVAQEFLARVSRRTFQGYVVQHEPRPLQVRIAPWLPGWIAGTGFSWRRRLATHGNGSQRHQGDARERSDRNRRSILHCSFFSCVSLSVCVSMPGRCTSYGAPVLP